MSVVVRVTKFADDGELDLMLAGVLRQGEGYGGGGIGVYAGHGQEARRHRAHARGTEPRAEAGATAGVDEWPYPRGDEPDPVTRERYLSCIVLILRRAELWLTLCGLLTPSCW
jgi:hypothetical protein